MMKNRLDQDAKSFHTIGELCEEFGVTPRTLRYYEQRQLVVPQQDGGCRAYSAQDRDRLQLILRTKRWGFSLTEIAKLLEICDGGDGTLSVLGSELPTLREQLRSLKQQRNELGDAIRDLEQCCTMLTSSVICVTEDKDN